MDADAGGLLAHAARRGSSPTLGLNGVPMMTNAQERRAIVGTMVAWCLCAILIDRFVLREHAAWLSYLLYFRNAQIVVKPFERTFTWLGLTLVLVVPSVIVGVILSVYVRATGKATTTESAKVFGL